MIPTAPLLRTSLLVFLSFFLIVSTGCSSGIPFGRPSGSSDGTLPELSTGAPVSVLVRSPEPSVSTALLTLSRTAESRPRQPRPSRFPGSIETSYRNRVLTEDATWSGQVLVEGSLTITPQATLFITPGTTVRFRPTTEGGSGFLLIRGRIQAVGAKDSPIIFTSDEINPAPGDWQGIMILDSSKKNILEWCRIESAVTGIAAEFSELALRQTSMTRSRTGMAVRTSSVVITGGGVSDCKTGVSSKNGDADLDGVKLSDNHRGITADGGSLFLSASEVTGSERIAIEATGTRLRFQGSSFVRNGVGVLLTGCRGDLVENRIEENRTVGLELADSPLKITGNRIIGNGTTGVMVRSGGATLWDNALDKNGDAELAVMGSEEVSAPGNWWGSVDLERIRGRIRVVEAGGTVLFTPLLGVPPSFP